MIPAGVMSAGAFTYEIQAFAGDAEVGTASRAFTVTGPESAALGSAR
jgi:hypothetical protein